MLAQFLRTNFALTFPFLFFFSFKLFCIDIRPFLFMQIPLYPATIFQGETDGEGISFVLYFKLSESFAKDLPTHFVENIRVSQS